VDEAAAGKCPVIPGGFLEADHHVLHVEAGAREIRGEYFQEFLLHFDAASHRPQNLDEDEVFVAVGLRIGIGRIKAKVLGVELRSRVEIGPSREPRKNKCSVYRVKNRGLERDRLRFPDRERDERHDDPPVY
jgi:hypothetical protein